MADPIRIPLSDRQRATLAAYEAQINQLVARRDGYVQSMIEAADVGDVQGYSLALDADAVRLTPPSAPPA